MVGYNGRLGRMARKRGMLPYMYSSVQKRPVCWASKLLHVSFVDCFYSQEKNEINL